MALQFGQIGIRIAPEAALQGASMAPLIEAPAHLSPPRAINSAEILSRERIKPGSRGSDQAHRAPHHGPGRGRLAARRAPLMIALRPKQMLKIVVGARQVRNRIAMEQPRAVAARDLAEVGERRSEPAGLCPMPVHGAKQAIEAPPDHLGRLVGGVAEHVGHRMHPAVGTPDLRP